MNNSITIASIQTMYANVEFQSLLEATWAAMFDQLGWRWNYEPYDLSGWTPRFRLESRVLVEVKPFTTLEEFTEEIEKIERAMKASNAYGSVLLLGTEIFGAPIESNENHVLGWIFVRCAEGELIDGDSYTDRARLYEVDGLFDFSEDEMGWGSKLGLISDKYRKWYGYPADPLEFTKRWAAATNSAKKGILDD